MPNVKRDLIYQSCQNFLRFYEIVECSYEKSSVCDVQIKMVKIEKLKTDFDFFIEHL